MSDLTINLHLAAMLLLLLGWERFPRVLLTGQTLSGEAVPGTAAGRWWTPKMGIDATFAGSQAPCRPPSPAAPQ